MPPAGSADPDLALETDHDSSPEFRLLHPETRLWMPAAKSLIFHLVLWSFRARTRRRLRALDPRLLDDVGLSRREALSEGWKPFWRA